MRVRGEVVRERVPPPLIGGWFVIIYNVVQHVRVLCLTNKLLKEVVALPAARAPRIRRRPVRKQRGMRPTPKPSEPSRNPEAKPLQTVYEPDTVTHPGTRNHKATACGGAAHLWLALALAEALPLAEILALACPAAARVSRRQAVL